ncbi:maleylpyruvate isomerase family mycothiol-dependent enzyme [Pseudonocardia adelaidensis]|uniref:Maleylpyruvate isomerase family mycothiol-dependent enzyme n=1 Tax=Pseudonocardia adelaidensis TaxID=648754 RepID=A0ABP9NAF8_9PSEU
MQSLEMDVDRMVTGLREVTGALADAIAGLDPQGTVPTCPEWRVRDLVGHIGQAYRWSAGLVRSRAAAPPPDPRDSEPGRSRDWPAWLRDGAADLEQAIGETGPDTAVWTFVGERPARFWLRRMMADTAVHVADAAFAAGRPFSVAPDLAAEAISEGLGLISAAAAAGLKPELEELRGDGQTLQLRPADLEPGWLVTRAPGGVTWERATGDADVVVAAPVADLLLVFSRRITPDDPRLAISGDRALLDHWWAHTAF